MLALATLVVVYCAWAGSRGAPDSAVSSAETCDFEGARWGPEREHVRSDAHGAKDLADAGVESGELVAVPLRMARGCCCGCSVGGCVAYGLDALGRVCNARDILVGFDLGDGSEEVPLRVRAKDTAHTSVSHGAFSGRCARGVVERVHEVGVVGVDSGRLVQYLDGAAQRRQFGDAK